MNVIVDEVVAVLQVLTFGNTVGGNQNIKLIGAFRAWSTDSAF